MTRNKIRVGLHKMNEDHKVFLSHKKNDDHLTLRYILIMKKETALRPDIDLNKVRDPVT